MAQSGLYKRLRIADIREEVPGFKTLVFADDHGILYQAGQYLTLVRFEFDGELRRSYSIISAPVLSEPLSIGVKRVANGAFSRTLIDHAQVGDELTTTGSGGFFVLPSDLSPYQQLFFFAAGSGITPVFSLLKTVLHTHPQLSVVLVYSNASPEKTVFLEPLRLLQQQFAGRFHLELLFSNAVDLSRARLNRDLLLSFVQHYKGWNKTLFYICGPESYMRLCTYTLQGEGVAPECIKKENFYFSNMVKRDFAPPDVHDHQATVWLQGQPHTFVVRYPASILKAAQQQGLVLPYSCEAGRCGNCVAQCTAGTVWHSYNEVLTEKELAQGLVLTCVGHPYGGDVTLKVG